MTTMEKDQKLVAAGSEKGSALSKSEKAERRRQIKEKAISNVCEATGWSREFAKEQIMQTRKRLGVTYSEYSKYQLYRMDEEQQDEAFKKILRKRALKRLRREVMAQTGWDRATARAAMTAARKEYGITNKEYVTHQFYALSDDEKAARAEEIKAKKEQLKKSREACITAAMKEMGWSREEAIRQIQDAKKRLKISYNEYRWLRLARVIPEDQEREYQRHLNARRERKAEQEEQLAQIIARTGWSAEEVEARFQEARARTGCRWGEYWQYHFDQLTDEQQDEILLRCHRDKVRTRYPYNKEMARIIESKAQTNEFFKDYITRTWCLTTGLTFETFASLFSGEPGFVYKPVFGLQARGVEAFYFDKYSLEEAFAIVSSYPQGVLEQLVIQHPKMNLLNPHSTNTVRMVTVSSTRSPVTADGAHIDLLGASVKIGGGSSIVDNLHAGGGVCAALDLETGAIVTDGADWAGYGHAEAPVTGTVLKGFEIPYFQEAKELVFRIIEQLSLNGVLGWDMAIGENGPALIEPNTLPDLALLSIPYAAEKKGIRSRIDKYFW